MTLTHRQLTDFGRDGFLVVPQVVDADSLSAIHRAMAARVQDLLRRCGQPVAAADDAADMTALGDNLARLLQAAPAAYQHIDISLPMVQNMAACVPEWQALFGDDWHESAGIFAHEAIFNLITHPNIVSIATQLLGEEVIASPVQHVRIKPPQRRLSGSAAQDANTARTLWHQDEAVVTEDARGANILTVWVAITDATLQNGCMQAAAGSHRAPDTAAAPDYGLTKHCPGKGDLVGEIYIPDADVDKTRLAPLIAKAGDVVLLHKRTVHGAGANASNGIRWSFDMRYQPAGTPSGRECFPATLVASRAAPADVARSPAAYKQSWLAARDAIVAGKVRAIFNSRWNKYAPLCA